MDWTLNQEQIAYAKPKSQLKVNDLTSIKTLSI